MGWAKLVFCITCSVLVLACASKEKELLQTEYTALGDDQLLEYYFQINERIDECEAEDDRGSVGVGTRVGSGGVGFGIGIATGLGLTGCDMRALRERRIEVRKSLRERDLIQ